MKHSLKTTEVVSCLPRAFVARVPPTVRCAAAHARTSPQTPRHKHATLCMQEKAVERAACMARAVAASQSRCCRRRSVLGANGTPPPRPRSVTTLRLSSKGQRGTPCDAYIRAGQAPTPPSGAVVTVYCHKRQVKVVQHVRAAKAEHPRCLLQQPHAEGHLQATIVVLLAEARP